MTAPTDTDVDVEILEGLARKIQSRRLDEREKPPRAHDTVRQGDIWFAGYLAGLCAALAQLTGGDSLEIERRIVAEASA